MQGLATAREKRRCHEQWSNGKNNANNNGNSRKCRRVPTSCREAARRATALCARRGPAKRVCCRITGWAWAQSNARPDRWGSGRANVTLNLMPCATLAGNASGINLSPLFRFCPSWPMISVRPTAPCRSADRSGACARHSPRAASARPARARRRGRRGRRSPGRSR
jgi:hypothetical protein